MRRSLLRTRLWGWVRAPRPRDERGDVPGWVMVTVMTAGLVTVIWGVADGRLTDLLNAAFDSVR